MPTTLGQYLVSRLESAGLRHIFGIPGDYVLSFYDLLEASNIKVVGTCTEIGAGFAADAYARASGLGALCVTYCVGGLNALNAVAGAYAEESPLILISGAPGMAERSRSHYLHHKVRDFDTQRAIYEKVTVAAVALEDPITAPAQIDDAIALCLRHKRPVYIELPRDMVMCAYRPRPRRPELPLKSDAKALAEAVSEAAGLLRAAKKPAILAGVEIHRFGLQPRLLKLLDRSGYPIASTLLGKSVISERHPQHLGIYGSVVGRDLSRRTIEGSDALLMLGAFMSDIDGLSPGQFNEDKLISVTSERISIRHHHFDNVLMGDFLAALTKASLGPRRKAIPGLRRSPAKTASARAAFKPVPNQPLSIRRFFARMNEYLQDNDVVVCDVGDSLFGASDLVIHRGTEFISPAYYTSMGFAVPAALGVQMARKKLRPIIFVGDGAFQMTGHELSSIVRQNLNPIVFVLNNRGYTTERFIHEGPYNNIHEWEYHLMPQLLGKGWGCQLRTEGELEEALLRAREQSEFSILNLHMDPWDCSEALERVEKDWVQWSPGGNSDRIPAPEKIL